LIQVSDKKPETGDRRQETGQICRIKVYFLFPIQTGRDGYGLRKVYAFPEGFVNQINIGPSAQMLGIYALFSAFSNVKITCGENDTPSGHLTRKYRNYR
jgi:hypothetical protein